jgi:uncharacterized protein (DUF1778 family)
MAALVKDDGTLHHTSFRVSGAAARKFIKALKAPKKPNAKLIALMGARKVCRAD